MLTETEELTLRRDTLAQELEKARGEVAAREKERTEVLAELTSQRDQLLSSVAQLEREVEDLETAMFEVEEEWKTATREADGAKKHLRGLYSDQ